jgi:hypothetical protein
MTDDTEFISFSFVSFPIVLFGWGDVVVVVVIDVEDIGYDPERCYTEIRTWCLRFFLDMTKDDDEDEDYFVVVDVVNDDGSTSSRKYARSS